MTPTKGALKNGIRVLGLRCCQGKTRYTKEEAEEQLRLARVHDKGLVRYGPCIGCGEYHIGHKRKQ